MFALLALLGCGPTAPEPAEAPVPARTNTTPQAQRLVVREPRARAMPPGAGNSGAFMTLGNKGGASLKVVAAEAPVARVVELHTHVSDGGMMKMRQIPAIEVPATGEVVLKPGGLHVMLIGLKEPLVEGMRFPLTLKLDDGSSQVVDVPVKAIEPAH